ncbi:hypothetical protein SAMN05216466_106215 [Paraburkholderia phenazinium]|uniref:Uncharacterized protein n=1 Tax=Paraburkholderia phenazinium TaxID=60549 RepID=A0A1G7YJQ3_9BURK|nr:hypothetical protein [Paraburkholderia phenazinium]SDG96617.1 hypothetical protein SAMN05216466_106215 [Paraburkholderia phenazinium]
MSITPNDPQAMADAADFERLCDAYDQQHSAPIVTPGEGSTPGQAPLADATFAGALERITASLRVVQVVRPEASWQEPDPELSVLVSITIGEHEHQVFVAELPDPDIQGKARALGRVVERTVKVADLDALARFQAEFNARVVPLINEQENFAGMADLFALSSIEQAMRDLAARVAFEEHLNWTGASWDGKSWRIPDQGTGPRWSA